MEECNIFWGSHGCDKPVDHVENGGPFHVCDSKSPEGPCIRVIEVDGKAYLRYYLQDDNNSTGALSQEFEVELFY